MAKVQLNFSLIDAAVQEAFNETCLILHSKMIQNITSDRWAWDSPPSPRDIVDTGLLRAAQQPPRITGSRALFENTIEYGLLVHEGYTRRDGGESPARPWMKITLLETPPQELFNVVVARKIR